MSFLFIPFSLFPLLTFPPLFPFILTLPFLSQILSPYFPVTLICILCPLVLPLHKSNPLTSSLSSLNTLFPYPMSRYSSCLPCKNSSYLPSILLFLSFFYPTPLTFLLPCTSYPPTKIFFLPILYSPPLILPLLLPSFYLNLITLLLSYSYYPPSKILLLPL